MWGQPRYRGPARAETQRDTLQKNTPKRTGADGNDIEKNGLKPHGPEQAGPRQRLSGPRYRGSNPCLPANLQLTQRHALRRILSSPTSCVTETQLRHADSSRR